MKKIMALLLAVLMIFSVTTVAFAADDTTAEVPAEGETTESTEIALGEFSWLLDLPLWTVGPGLKIAKIALKFVKIYLKLSSLFGKIPESVADEIERVILETIEKSQQAETTPAAVLA